MRFNIDITPEQEKAFAEAFGPRLGLAAVEALVIEGYRAGKFGAADVGRLLNLGDRFAVDRWLAERKVTLGYTADDLESDARAIDRAVGGRGNGRTG